MVLARRGYYKHRLITRGVLLLCIDRIEWIDLLLENSATTCAVNAALNSGRDNDVRAAACTGLRVCVCTRVDAERL